MASIQVNNGIPHDFAQLDTSTYDDRWDDTSGRTEVTATANVINTGNADGRVRIVIVDSASDNILESSGWAVVAAGEGEEVAGEATVRVNYRVPNDARKELRAEVWDGDDQILESESFSGNSYAVPRGANLSSSPISINVG